MSCLLHILYMFHVRHVHTYKFVNTAYVGNDIYLKQNDGFTDLILIYETLEVFKP